MRRQKVDNQVEKQLLTSLVTSTDFLAQAAGPLETERDALRDLPLFDLVAQWCLVYYGEYRKAPGIHIETVYHAWADGEPEADLVDAVHDLLVDLSGNYEQAAGTNVPYLLDELGKYLSKRKLDRLRDDLDGLLSQGKSVEASDAVARYRSVRLGGSVGVDLLNDDEVWDRTFSEPAKPLITMGGDAGKFFDTAFTRDALVAIQAPEKRGKTWFCIELALTALLQRRRVAMFQTGDLSESQLAMRFGVRFARAPLRKSDCGKVRFPNEIVRDETESLGFTVDYDFAKCKKPVSYRKVKEGRDEFKRSCGVRSKDPYYMQSVHASGTVNVRGINAILDQWKLERGFVPDVVVIDYADILAPEEERKEGRDMVNDTWKALRRLSQERHALVLTPTQASAASYDAKTQGMKHFSNDKRKLAHVTGMFALNQTDEEKEAQVMRLNWIVLRESAFNVKRCLYVGQCLTLGHAITCATL